MQRQNKSCNLAKQIQHAKDTVIATLTSVWICFRWSSQERCRSLFCFCSVKVWIDLDMPAETKTMEVVPKYLWIVFLSFWNILFFCTTLLVATSYFCRIVSNYEDQLLIPLHFIACTFPSSAIGHAIQGFGPIKCVGVFLSNLCKTSSSPWTI